MNSVPARRDAGRRLAAITLAATALTALASGTPAGGTPPRHAWTRSAQEVPSRPVVAADLAPRLDNDSGHSEFWNFTLLLEPDIVVVLSLFRTNLGFPIGRIAGSELSIMGVAAEPVVVVRRFDNDRFYYDGAADAELRVHPNIGVQGALGTPQRLVYDTAKNGQRVELDFVLTAPSLGAVAVNADWELGPGRQLGFLPLIGRARAVGVLTVDGDRHDLRGWATLEHIFFSERPDELAVKTFQLIEQAADRWRMTTLVWPTPRGGRRPFGYVATGGSEPTQVQSVAEARLDAEPGHADPVDLRLVFPATGADWPLTLAPPLQRLSAIDHFGGLARLVFRTFVGGEVEIERGFLAIPGRSLYTRSAIR